MIFLSNTILMDTKKLTQDDTKAAIPASNIVFNNEDIKHKSYSEICTPQLDAAISRQDDIRAEDFLCFGS